MGRTPEQLATRLRPAHPDRPEPRGPDHRRHLTPPLGLRLRTRRGAGRAGGGGVASRGRRGAELKRRRACRDFKYRAWCREGWWESSGLSFPAVNGAHGQGCARRRPGGVVRASPLSREDSKEVRGEVGGAAVARDEAPQYSARARK